MTGHSGAVRICTPREGVTRFRRCAAPATARSGDVPQAVLPGSRSATVVADLVDAGLAQSGQLSNHLHAEAGGELVPDLNIAGDAGGLRDGDAPAGVPRPGAEPVGGRAPAVSAG